MKKAGFYAIFFCLLGLVSLLLCEVLLRLYPGPWNPEVRWVNGAHPGIIDTVLGPWNRSNFTGHYRTREFFVKNIHWNQYGMRDLPRTLSRPEGKRRIAILGDSFMEAVQVPDEATMARQLEKRLAPGWEVLNFGKGGIGTCEEYLVYVHRARQFDPDVVLLVFWPGNDVLNNSLRLVEGEEGKDKNLIHPYYLKDSATGKWYLKPASPNPDLPPVKKDFRYYLKQYTALYRFWRYFRDTWQPKHAPVWLGGHAEPEQLYAEDAKEPFELRWKGYGVYVPPRTRAWQEAWEVTAWCLEQLNEAVKAEGAELIVVAIPPVIDTTMRKIRLEEALGETLPASFSWNYPTRRLRQLADTLGAGFIDLTGPFQQYASENDCAPPCFFWPKDGHWNALGHEVAAATVASELLRGGWLEADSSRFGNRKIDFSTESPSR